MNCNDAQNKMPLRQSGELDERESFEFEGHLKTCAACKSEMDLQKQYDELLHAAFAEQTLETTALRECVRSQIRGLQEEKRRRTGLAWTRWNFRFALVAASVLIVVCAGIFYFAVKRNQPTIYAGVARDYTEDVIERMPKEGWRDDETEAVNYARQQLGDESVAAALAPDGYRLVRTRVCNPAGMPFVHLIFDNGERQISFYVRKRDGTLPGNPVEIINNHAFYAERINSIEIAAFQSAQFTVLLASDLPRTENLRLASDAFARLT